MQNLYGIIEIAVKLFFLMLRIRGVMDKPSKIFHADDADFIALTDYADDADFIALTDFTDFTD